VFNLEICFKTKSALFSQARPSFFLSPAGPRARAQPKHATCSPSPTRRRTLPNQRPSPPLKRSYRDARCCSPPALAWRRPHWTPLFPLCARPSRLFLAFLFPCSGIEAVSSGPHKTPRLSTTPTTSPASRDLTHRRRPRGALLHTGIMLEHRRPALFDEVHPACRSSSFGLCLMTTYPRRCRRSSLEPPPTTIRLLHRRAPSSRPASATSMRPITPLLARRILHGPL
jgi:hypothetical protein